MLSTPATARQLPSIERKNEESSSRLIKLVKLEKFLISKIGILQKKTFFCFRQTLIRAFSGSSPTNKQTFFQNSIQEVYL